MDDRYVAVVQCCCELAVGLSEAALSSKTLCFFHYMVLNLLKPWMFDLILHHPLPSLITQLHKPEMSCRIPAVAAMNAGRHWARLSFHFFLTCWYQVNTRNVIFCRGLQMLKALLLMNSQIHFLNIISYDFCSKYKNGYSRVVAV